MYRIGVGIWLCVALAFLTAPTMAQDEIIPWPTEGWQTSTPEAQGMDSVVLSAMLDEIAKGGINIHSVLVIRNGYLVLEAYGYPYTAEMPHQLNSATKSFASALVGIALDQGAIESIDEPMQDFFGERDIDNLDVNKQAITLENLLTMTAGLDWSTATLERPNFGEMINSPDWVQYVLDRPMKNDPGTQFVYNSGGSHLLAVLVEEKTGESLLDFAQTNLFSLLGIQPGNWQQDPQGHYFGGRGLDLTPRDMAKFGYLFLNNGEWDGQQIIPADYVATATQKQIPARQIADGYGYQWWIDFRGYYMAAGYGGQYIIVDPAKNLVAVFTAGLNIEQTITQRNNLFDDQVLEAIKSDSALPDNPSGAAALAVSIDALAHPTPQAVAPLPETANHISDKVYRLAANDFGWETFSLTFSEGADTAQSHLNDEPPLDIGLDGLYRVSTQSDGAWFAKGSWTTDKRFVLQFSFAGAAEGLRLTMTFEDQDVKMLLRDELSGNVFPLEGTVE
jgi:CubicO group peptidase (beta-lactamase class C family)